MKRSSLLMCGLAAASLVACNGDDVTATTDTAGTTTDATSSTTSSGTTTTSGTSTSTTDASGTATMGETTSTTSTTTDPTTTTTGETTGVMTTTTTSDTDVCICEPGEAIGECQDEGMVVCAADCLTYEVMPCQGGQTCLDGQCIDLLCNPGTKQCQDDENYVVCNDDGMDFGDPQACGNTEGCLAGECVPLCDLIQNTPSSIGCSFFGNRMDNFDNDPAGDSLVVGNTSETKTATVQLYFTPNNSNNEQTQGGPVNLGPGQTHVFLMPNQPMDKVSRLRQGGSYRVESDIPIIAYQHSPIGQDFTNDASMLLPEHALKQNYILASYKASLSGYANYFNVIAVEDDTTVEWTPTANTISGTGVNAVTAGQTGSATLNRHDTLQVRAGNSTDLSGSFVTADKPIWVVAAVECVNVPAGVTFCDHIEEQMLPLDYWGKKYVGAPSPKRGTEDHHWRIFGGDDGVTVTTTPAQPGTPVTLNKGEWKDLVVSNGTAFIFEADGPFLPVQYLESQNSGAGTGDPSMYQMVPVEQFLNSYAFVTGTDYPNHYAQIIRPVGAADVTIDGNTVNGYYTVGGFEVADVKISEGGHLAKSADPFGIVGLGYSGATSYAYPG
ncbi:MAG: IgGFc-binding protein, partial [Myxococcales bacterium]|nr:IgGFc-binding protein [Myxococcales bacterium]